MASTRSLRVLKVTLTYIMIVLLAGVNALSYQLFVFPNHFAPAGLNGICTMVQYLFDFKLGYLNLIINIPLAVAVYFLVSKKTALRSLAYAIPFSVFVLLLDNVDLSPFIYSTANGTSLILGPLAAGLITGAIAAMLFRSSANCGGTESVAAIIHKYVPHVNFFWIIFALNVSVACLSYFVYDYQIEPVLLCVIYCFGSSMLRDQITRSTRRAVRFEIVTDHPGEISRALMEQLHHGVTLTQAKGMYGGKEHAILMCIVNKGQIPTVVNIVDQFPDTFAAYSDVAQVLGNFKRLDSHGNAHASVLDK